MECIKKGERYEQEHATELKKWKKKKPKQKKWWLTTELHETSSLMRAMTSWAKVPGQSTWDTRPLAHASWAVSFLPLSNISLAWKKVVHVYFHVKLF